jgi:SAM-dependent methyltransferase
VAGAAIDWRYVGTILDAGCGYGWFEQVLDGPFDLVVGIDTLRENEEPFMGVATRIAKKAEFRELHLPCATGLPSGCFDLVVAGYSLYFFPEALPELARVLAPDGLFLAITHSERMLEEGERFFRFTNLRSLIRRFSAEDGERVLKACFGRVTWIDYPNRLVFNREDTADLEAYVFFKHEFVSRDADPAEVHERLLQELRSGSALSFNKDDRIFLARK